MRHSLTLILACGFVALSAAPAAAIKYKFYHDREIIQSSDLVVVGTVIQIISPLNVATQKKDAVSVAVVRVEKVFKGDIKKGNKIRLVFWSHDAKPKNRWRSPDKYKLGEASMLTLNQKRPQDFKQYLAPPATRTAPWVNRFRHPYNSQIQNRKFRLVAEIWREPAKHLLDPKLRAAAVFFLAHQKQLSEQLLLELLRSTNIPDQIIGCEAAAVVKSHAALEPIVAIIETRGKQRIPSEKWSFLNGAEKPQQAIHRVYAKAIGTVHKIPIDSTKDGPVLLRLAICGGMTREFTVIILRSGKARWEVTQGLIKSLKTQPTVAAAASLQRLNARVAYDWVKLLAAPKNGKRSLAAGRLVNDYDTLWAMRHVLKHAHDQTRLEGSPAHYQADYVRNSFGFTRLSIDPYDRRKDAGKGNGTSATRYAELRRYAQEQLKITEKHGPSFNRLPARLKRFVFCGVYAVGGSSYVTLKGPRHEKLMKLIAANADVAAVNLDARAPAVWLVDLHWPVYSRLPLGQLWVAADGTFGLSWLPDRAWGKSRELAMWLKSVTNK